MSTAEAQPASLRCHHCGRAVAETTHLRTSYRVDHYTLYTGEVEPVTRIREDTDETVTVLKLVRPIVITTCADCYARPEIRAERDCLFRPEDAERPCA